MDEPLAREISVALFDHQRRVGENSLDRSRPRRMAVDVQQGSRCGPEGATQ